MPSISDRRVAQAAFALGMALRDRRNDLELTLKTVAASAGITEAYLSDVERGRRLPTVETLLRLAAAVDTDLCSLLAGRFPYDATAPRVRARPVPDGRSRQTP